MTAFNLWGQLVCKYKPFDKTISGHFKVTGVTLVNMKKVSGKSTIKADIFIFKYPSTTRNSFCR